MSLSKPVIWTPDGIIIQNFSLPFPIIEYMLKNRSSPKLFQKLIECCKTFFAKTRIIVAPYISSEVFCLDYRCQYLDHLCECYLTYLSQGPFTYEDCCRTLMVLSKLKFKIWSTQYIRLYRIKTFEHMEHLTACITSIQIKELRISDSLLRLDHFNFMSQNIEELFLLNVKCVNIAGEPVMLESLMALCPKLQKIQHCSDETDTCMINAEFFKKLANAPNLKNLKLVKLIEIPLIVNPLDAISLLNQNPSTEFSLAFCKRIDYNLYPADLLERLESLVDAVIQAQIPGRDISYYGEDKAKRLKLKNL